MSRYLYFQVKYLPFLEALTRASNEESLVDVDQTNDPLIQTQKVQEKFRKSLETIMVDMKDVEAKLTEETIDYCKQFMPLNMGVIVCPYLVPGMLGDTFARLRQQMDDSIKNVTRSLEQGSQRPTGRRMERELDRRLRDGSDDNGDFAPPLDAPRANSFDEENLVRMKEKMDMVDDMMRNFNTDYVLRRLRLVQGFIQGSRFHSRFLQR